MNRHVPIYRVAAWTLLLLWTIFAGSELAEATQLIEEVVTDTQGNYDLDEETLLQLACIPKSDVDSPEATNAVSSTITAIVVTWLFPESSPRPSYWLNLHDPPRLPLYQQVSIYRI